MKHILLWISIILAYSLSLQAQKLTFSEVTRMSWEVNSAAEEVMPLYNTQQNKLYFSRAIYAGNKGGKYGGMDIWMSGREGSEKWTEAINSMNEWNNIENNAVIGVKESGDIVYMLQAYGRGEGIAFSKLIDGKWSSPELIPIKGLKGAGISGLYMNPDFDILLLSMEGRDSYGQEDLYVSLKNNSGEWSSPENLGTTINTTKFEISPYLSNDGKRLYFSSAGHEGYGDADIYMSERLYDSWNLWTVPQNLGSEINSDKFDAYFSIYGDSLAFFSSNRGREFSDLYSAQVTVSHRQAATSTINERFGTVDDKAKKHYLSETEIKNVLGVTVNLDVAFRKNSYELEPAVRERLYFITSKLTNEKDIRLEIEGYGDSSSGEKELNESLARWRVLAIISFLKSNNIDTSRMYVSKLKFNNITREEGQQVRIKLYQQIEQP